MLKLDIVNGQLKLKWLKEQQQSYHYVLTAQVRVADTVTQQHDSPEARPTGMARGGRGTDEE